MFAGWVFSVVNLFSSNWLKDKLMPVTLVPGVLCKQQIVCGLEMDGAVF